MNNKNIGAGNQVRTQLARWQSYLVPESENHGESAMTGENKSAIMIPANPIQTVAQKKQKVPSKPNEYPYHWISDIVLCWSNPATKRIHRLHRKI